MSVIEREAESVIIVAEAVKDGFLRIAFKQGDKTTPGIVLQYSRDGEMMRNAGDPSETERKAHALNRELRYVNALLERWCS